MKTFSINIIYKSFQRSVYFALAVSFILSFVTSVPQQLNTLSDRTHPIELIINQPHTEFILTATHTTRTEEKIAQTIADAAIILSEGISNENHSGTFTFHSTVATTSLSLRLIYTQITSSCL